jgi:nucleoid-associated protein YgaU
MQKHKVLRPICVDGERVEVGSIVALVPTLGAELRAAGKVERIEGDDDKAPEAKPADPRAKVVKAAKPPKAEADKAPEAPKD